MKVLVTGATSGIGRQLALDYHGAGHEVWALGRSREALAELARLGLNCAQLDLTDRDAVLAWCAPLGGLDLVILNAGTCEYQDMPGFDAASFIRVMRANVESMAICIEGLLPKLLGREGARLVGVCSSAAYLPLPRAEAYGASKAAVRYLLECLDITLAPHKVAVSTVYPGFVRTPLTDRNDFPMPLAIDVVAASRHIRQGIARGRRHIHFPKAFTWPLRLLGLLPQWLWRPLASRMIKQ
ncbi:SDR family NAD(P)-dependent oxidoreductase [Gallaecimonas xiamenensis]|uniref:Oxidoreductase n=1 Tax=Gallaecimonas xiamenensis 3-C-1 TaxID=745411 RepID=K2KHH8_9GAMM|nr:SDR family NAD(P)-dependent oxidoreductase [Gallaecimonas xiamenensis]EKE76715.1 oxidoreductase [Gallaecimonas xiamenensis 3-C-1]